MQTKAAVDVGAPFNVPQPIRYASDRTKVWKLKDAGKFIREIAAEMENSNGTVQRALEARKMVAAQAGYSSPKPSVSGYRFIVLRPEREAPRSRRMFTGFKPR